MIQVFEDNIQIIDSYKVSKTNFAEILDKIWSDLPDHKVVKTRKKRFVQREWAVHNLCYKLGIYRSRTKDLDINSPLKIQEAITYALFGGIALMVID